MVLRAHGMGEVGVRFSLGPHYTKKFGLIPSRIPTDVLYAERVVALTKIVRSTNRPPSIRAVQRGEMRTRFCKNYLLGERISQNARLMFLKIVGILHFARAEEGSGKESARAFSRWPL